MKINNETARVSALVSAPESFSWFDNSDIREINGCRGNCRKMTGSTISNMHTSASSLEAFSTALSLVRAVNAKSPGGHGGSSDLQVSPFSALLRSPLSSFQAKFGVQYGAKLEVEARTVADL